MIRLKTLIISLFSLLFFKAGAQCNSEVKVFNSLQEKSLSSDELKVEIATIGQFNAKLFAIESTRDKLIGEFNSGGSDSHTFRELSRDSEYRLVVQFTSESEFLCKKRIVDGILLTKSID